MKHVLICLSVSVFIWSVGAWAEIHKWIDESGKIHYGDRPPESSGMQTLEISVESFSSVEVRELNSADLSVLAREQKNIAKSKNVVMYSTQSCGYCKKAKAYFSSKGIKFTERDINNDPSARKQWEKLNGTGVPLILVGKSKMSGFSQSRFEQLYFN